MIRVLFSFLVLWVLIAIGVSVFRSMTGRERWAITKIATFASATAFVAFVVLVGIVVLF